MSNVLMEFNKESNIALSLVDVPPVDSFSFSMTFSSNNDWQFSLKLVLIW